MKLRDLFPQLKRNGHLVFDCPKCGPHIHRIRVPLHPAVDLSLRSWKPEGEFPDTLTVTPSIDAGCWHGSITNGEVLSA